MSTIFTGVLGALEFDGPAIVVCYTTCQPEHGVADNMAGEQAAWPSITRAFPILIYDPRPQGRTRSRNACPCRAIPRQGRLVRQPEKQRNRDLHRFRPQRRPLRQTF